MNEYLMKVIEESLVSASELGALKALAYVKTGLETYKKVEIPRVSEDGQYCYGTRKPYKEDKEVQTFIDFMIVYLDEAIKMIEDSDKDSDKKDDNK